MSPDSLPLALDFPLSWLHLPSPGSFLRVLRSLTRTDIGVICSTLVFLWSAKGAIGRRRARRGLKPLPGPRGLPIVGNLFQLPKKEPWREYERLCKEYGGMAYLQVPGSGILLLGTLEAVDDLLEKRSSVNSDRPSFPAFELMDATWPMTITQYNKDLRAQRREFHRQLGPGPLPRFHPIFEEEIFQFLKNLHGDPDVFRDHMKEMFGSTIVRVAYGSHKPEVARGLIDDGDTAMKVFSETTQPGAYMVNHIPALKYVPAWFPGAGWRTKFEGYKAIGKRVLYGSFDKTKEMMASGKRSAVKSMAEDAIEKTPQGDQDKIDEYIRAVQCACAVAYVGGAETVKVSLCALFLALAMHPEVQRKAQLEIDTVVGRGRLPTMADRDSLPYITAIFKETSRWHPTTPMAFPHVASQDDEYKGYFIPKGTFIMGNVWSLLHDPSVYENPSEFNPDRFIKDGKYNTDIRDPEIAMWGFGRRICPGKWFADDMLFLVTASILWAFDISPARDECGNPIPLKLEPSPNTVSDPGPFKVHFKSRSELHSKMLSQ